ncbi:hypothetical protein E2C01_073247 [Portunus trituberculatus]|uniref:Uncharacterized protein n=1 Tax=Portunus trituberculatus TaxID=210409 RepID=A0A5B7I2B4_PORTR|nr:hypothetical protein [Portunus trituberculatus]
MSDGGKHTAAVVVVVVVFAVMTNTLIQLCVAPPSPASFRSALPTFLSALPSPHVFFPPPELYITASHFQNWWCPWCSPESTELSTAPSDSAMDAKGNYSCITRFTFLCFLQIAHPP